jgi:hypothetical protein
MCASTAVAAEPHSSPASVTPSALSRAIADSVPGDSSRTAKNAIKEKLVAARRLGDSALAEIQRLIKGSESDPHSSDNGTLAKVKQKFNELVEKGRQIDVSLPQGTGQKLSQAKQAMSKWAKEARDYLAQVQSEIKGK